MADGAYCDYQQQMESMLPHLTNYGGRSAQEHIGDGNSHSKGGAGFYMEQFPPGMPVTVMESLGLNTSTANLSGHSGISEAMAASMMNQAAGMFESAMNYALKPEKGLPPTPPGSPDEPKDSRQQPSSSQSGYHSSMHPASMVALQSSINPNVLAKPVPVRRPSEKNLSSSRSNLPNSSPTELPMPIDGFTGLIIRIKMSDMIERFLESARGFYPPQSMMGSQDYTMGLGVHQFDYGNPYMAPQMWGPPPDSGGGGGGASPALARALAAVQQTQKRPRSEKKPIPDEQKDQKYFDRRKRNNSAAKKSRDARKAREDEIAIRASFLEKENAILRAQVTTLREEANSLRQLLLQKRSRH